MGRFTGKVPSSPARQPASVRRPRSGLLPKARSSPSTASPISTRSETLRKIKEAGGEAFAIAADMRDPAQVKAMVDEVGQARRPARLHRLQCGDQSIHAVGRDPIEDFDELFETNVRGAWVVCTEGAKQMIAEGHGGAIVMISSISAHVGAPTQVAYCGTKGAISMLGKALGSVLGKNGIRVNASSPARSGPT